MVHDNGVKGTLGRTGAATGTGRRVDHGRDLLFDLHADGIVGADLRTFAA